MPWPRRSAKGRDDRGADGDGGRVDKAHDEDEASPSMPPTRKKAPLGFGAATLNASLSPVSGSLTSIQVKRPSSSQSVSDTINKLLKPRVRKAGVARRLPRGGGPSVVQSAGEGSFFPFFSFSFFFFFSFFSFFFFFSFFSFFSFFLSRLPLSSPSHPHPPPPSNKNRLNQ